jgi:quinol-cytochrome oxidoreductase complex cytochrome b subunit
VENSNFLDQKLDGSITLIGMGLRGFAVDNATLYRFFTFHFLLPLAAG